MFERIIAKENLYLSAHRASLGKRFRDNIGLWRLNIEKEVDRLHEDLKHGRYRHGRYRIFQIWDPKKRNISVAPFRDRVVHHAFHDVIELEIDKKFIFDSYACRQGKGTHIALDRADRFIRANRYCFHGDVRKYFPSIEHGILKNLLRRYIEDVDVLKVLDNIIDSAGTQGLPIGNLTSQFFANVYLHELDHFVKHVLHGRYYMRYMDDFLIFDNDRARLDEIRSAVREFLASRLHLELHAGKSQIMTCSSGVKFLGFRLFGNRRRMATVGVRRLRRRLKTFRHLIEGGVVTEEKAVDSILSWTAHSANADAAALRERLAEETMVWNEALSAAFLTSGRPGLCRG